MLSAYRGVCAVFRNCSCESNMGRSRLARRHSGGSLRALNPKASGATV